MQKTDAAPTHPQYGKPQSGKPVTIGGVTFRPYRTGVNRSSWLSDDYRIRVGRIGNRSTFDASVDQVGLGKRFRSQRTAMEAAVKRMKVKP